MADQVSDVVVKLVQMDLAPIVSAGQRREISPEAFQAAQDLEGVSADRLAIGATLSKDLSEIEQRERTGYLTPDQARILMNRAKDEARAREQSAYAEAKRTYERLGDAIDAELTPKLDPAREQAARDELQMAFGPSEPNPEGKALWLAVNSNDEVVAALLSPYAERSCSRVASRTPTRSFERFARARPLAQLRNSTPRRRVFAERTTRASPRSSVARARRLADWRVGDGERTRRSSREDRRAPGRDRAHEGTR